MNFDGIAGYDFVMNDTGRIVTGILTRTVRVVENRCSQDIIGIHVGAAYTFVAHIGYRHIALPLHVHTDFQKYRDNARILANRPVPGRAHTRVDQYLRNSVFRRRILLALIGFIHGLNKVFWMVIRDKL